MAKRSREHVAWRLRAVDEVLGEFPGPHNAGFAKRYHVSTKTVRRDLRVIAALRRREVRIVCQREVDGRYYRHDER